jgi:hypothetical protein
MLVSVQCLCDKGADTNGEVELPNVKEAAAVTAVPLRQLTVPLLRDLVWRVPAAAWQSRPEQININQTQGDGARQTATRITEPPQLFSFHTSCRVTTKFRFTDDSSRVLDASASRSSSTSASMTSARCMRFCRLAISRSCCALSLRVSICPWSVVLTQSRRDNDVHTATKRGTLDRITRRAVGEHYVFFQIGNVLH